MDNNDDRRKLSDLITNGSNLAGAATGGALGFLAGGPASAAGAAMAGAALSKAIEKIGVELYDRLLGPRERQRVGAAASYAIVKIQTLLNDNRSLRSDGFFNEDASNRSSAEEVFEGALLKSKSAYEEKKIKHIGAFFANVSFDPEVTAQRANYYLQLVERLTFRQLKLLVILHNAEYYGLRLEALTDQRVSPEQWGLLQEINEIHDLSLLRQKNDQGERDLFWGLGAIKPGKMQLTRLGLDLVTYFDLTEVDRASLDSEIAMLK